MQIIYVIDFLQHQSNYSSNTKYTTLNVTHQNRHHDQLYVSSKDYHIFAFLQLHINQHSI